MPPVAIGRFDDGIVRGVHELRVAQQRLIDVAHVAGEHELFRLAILGQPQLDGSGTEQMPRIDEPRLNALRNAEPLAIRVSVKQLHGAHGVRHGVQRLDRRRAPALVLAVFPLRVRLLDVGAVAQHDVTQARRRDRGVDLTGKPLLIQQRDPPGMVDVRVRHQHKIELCRLHGQRLVLKQVLPLFHAIVHEETLARRFQVRAAAGHLVCSAQKCHAHMNSVPFPFFSAKSLQICRWICPIILSVL